MQPGRESSAGKTLNTEGIGQLPLWESGRILFALILSLLLVSELIARSPIGSTLPPPIVGADSFEFDIKVYYLEQSIRRRGALDCLIVGDSMANDGPDPKLMEEAYQTKTGKPLHCFNFGMPALTLDASGPLAKALNNRFQPKLLIFVLSARDFDPSYGAAFSHVAESDWTRYNLGKHAPRGWAVNSLYGYRYFIFGQYWLNPSNRPSFVNAWRDITPEGFTPLYGYGERREISDTSPTFNINSLPALQGLEQLLQIQYVEENLLVVDAPIQPDLREAYYENFFVPYIESMQSILAPRSIPFWLTDELANSIPTEAWYDVQHVNQLGVPIFSTWLGNKLAEKYPPEFFR